MHFDSSSIGIVNGAMLPAIGAKSALSSRLARARRLRLNLQLRPGRRCRRFQGFAGPSAIDADQKSVAMGADAMNSLQELARLRRREVTDG